MINDSADKLKCETGAERSSEAGKGRCDLLPLRILGNMCHSEFLKYISVFVYTGDADYLQNAYFSFITDRGWDFWTSIIEVSIHYEDGAKFHAERNWEKGLPLSRYISSAVRHWTKWKRGDTDESHDRAVLWNILGAMWTLENLSSEENLIDLPFRNRTA